jgi:2-dehydro-3-deoxyphosphogluconate aldolase/(4S)-4-hydroxy-2-oxoglutarate aldolase
MPSGGVKIEKDNLQKWFDSGSSLVALGTNLITKSIKENSDFSLLGQMSVQTLELIREVRS